MKGSFDRLQNFVLIPHESCPKSSLKTGILEKKYEFAPNFVH